MTQEQPQQLFGWRSIAVIVGLAAVWVLMLLLGTGSLDRTIYEDLYAGHRPYLISVARVLTALGEPTVLIGASIVCAICLWYVGRARIGLALFLVALTGRGISEIEKYAVGRQRPALEPHLVMVKTPSFPSGHATSSMIFYLALALALTGNNRWRRPVAAAAVLLS